MVISIKLRIADIDKSKIFTSEKGNRYLDLVLMDRRDGVDKYGNDGFIAHDTSKEERAEGVKGKIVGNWKYLVRDNGVKKPAGEAHKPAAGPTDHQDPW